MPTAPLTPGHSNGRDSSFSAVPASHYSYDQLAEIYNQSRVDYIVPMPMNARRLEEYVNAYDVDLDASAVVLASAGDVAGIGMLGVRKQRAWVTRVGVIPGRRGHGLGHFMMESLISQAVERGVRQIQLEVIRGNTPAHRLFLKLGFEETRELLVVRRPPGLLDVQPPPAFVRPLSTEEAAAALAKRDSRASWLDETTSLLNAGSLEGLVVQLPRGDSGWVVFRSTPFQLSHIVLQPDIAADVALALLFHLHTRHPAQDTKLENLPAASPYWPVFQSVGYHETFRRIEMVLMLV